jgi:quinol monooxygenase YgiN
LRDFLRRTFVDIECFSFVEVVRLAAFGALYSLKVLSVQEQIMGRIVIVAFKPKPGKQPELIAAVQKHCRILREEQLITDRVPAIMQGADGTIVEVFEWRSAEAIQQAHSNPNVNRLWGEFQAACDYVPLATVPESSQLFAEFTPVDL